MSSITQSLQPNSLSYLGHYKIFHRMSYVNSFYYKQTKQKINWTATNRVCLWIVIEFWYLSRVFYSSFHAGNIYLWMIISKSKDVLVLKIYIHSKIVVNCFIEKKSRSYVQKIHSQFVEVYDFCEFTWNETLKNRLIQ